MCCSQRVQLLPCPCALCSLSCCPAWSSEPGHLPASGSQLPVGPLNGRLSLQQPSVSPRENPADFHHQIFWGLNFPDTGGTGLGVHCTDGTSLFRRDLCKKISLPVPYCHSWVRGHPVLHLCLTPWLLYILRYKNYAQLVFRRFCRVTVLQFSFDILWEEVSTAFIYSAI